MTLGVSTEVLEPHADPIEGTWQGCASGSGLRGFPPRSPCLPQCPGLLAAASARLRQRQQAEHQASEARFLAQGLRGLGLYGLYRAFRLERKEGGGKRLSA